MREISYTVQVSVDLAQAMPPDAVEHYIQSSGARGLGHKLVAEFKPTFISLDSISVWRGTNRYEWRLVVGTLEQFKLDEKIAFDRGYQQGVRDGILKIKEQVRARVNRAVSSMLDHKVIG